MPSTRYLFRVQAMNVNGWSAFSSPHTEYLTQPRQPQKPRIIVENANRLAINWNRLDGYDVCYNLEYQAVTIPLSGLLLIILYQ